MLVLAFVDAFKQAEVQVEVEPRDRKEEDHCAPDGYIYGLRPGKKVAVDVSVCSLWQFGARQCAHLRSRRAQCCCECESQNTKIPNQTETNYRRLRGTCGRDLRCGRERGTDAIQGVSKLLEEKRQDYLESATIKSLAQKRERGAVGGGSEVGESGVNKILFGYKQDFFWSNA